MLTMNKIKSVLRQTNRHVRLDQFLDEKKYILCSIVLIGLFIVFMFNSFATLEPVSSITVKSTTLDYSKSEEGSWKYTKTAKWISKGKARINIKLETIEKPRAEHTDVILVLDTSGSMVKDKIEQLQKDVNELINDTIPKGNKISLITFNDTATIVNDFTDDASLLQESINNLTVSGETNYYQALIKVDDVLSTYNKESNRDCVVLFLTDGLPTTDTPNEVGEYKLLKEKYDYLSINGIQYELGDKVLDGIKNITDIQFIASKKTLNKFLYKASISPASYDNFVLTDYVDTDNFNLKNISNISTTFGRASIEDNQVIWNLDGLKTGLDAELTIDINLNDNLIGVGGVYPTHTKTDVAYKIATISATETTDKTTILKDNYVVTYEANTPTGCVVSGLPSSKVYSVFDTVRLDNSVPTCIGYQFKEWKIVTDDIEEVGNNQFIMPESNVKIKAIWKKLSISKAMDGKVATLPTLYGLMADNSIGLDTDVDFSTTPTTSNSGIYTIASTNEDKYPVHYYRGNIKNNNVLFAGFCWKMVRTTSTGGVKLIYNGVYDDTNKCDNRGDSTQIGTSVFNSTSYSLSDSGYMYGTKARLLRQTTARIDVLHQYPKQTSSFYYGTSISYSNGTYTLINSSQKSWSDNYSNLVGYYTCRSTSTTCSTVYYVAATTSSYLYALPLSSGQTNPNIQTITLGKNIVDNGDNTYTLTDVVTLKKSDWYQNYDTYLNYYICLDSTSTTCNGKYPIVSTNNFQLYYDQRFKYVYGNDVTWDGTYYTLTDTYVSENFWSEDRKIAAKRYHYTCLNTTGTCRGVYYIYNFTDTMNIYYLIISSGKNIEEYKKEQFSNVNDSTIKQVIDSWYQINMTQYTEKLEDTIWCNDRTFSSGSLVSKDDDASTYLYFNSYGMIRSRNPSVICPNSLRDGFTVSTDSGGNGALTYPVGLLTANEAMLAGGSGLNSNYYLYNGRDYWLLSPAEISDIRMTISFIEGSYPYTIGGDINQMNGNVTAGVRPSVSLVAGTKYTGGSGTVDDPYIVK